ncbi:hypothetical protein OG196_42720 [Kitasatospora purpeofusca]|uniref:hypothetical protein n=1 Tax=Kitasatospora purpeofusca TaxID=67352 RepID=UPI002E0EBBAD|nr:hypothetical protein OG196_42720 [Kitasatospora purpeofusca]
MTVEVGVITGDLTLRTVWDGRRALLGVQYDGADEWYTVEGSPLPARSAAEAESAHRTTAEAVRRGGGATAAGAITEPGPPHVAAIRVPARPFLAAPAWRSPGCIRALRAAPWRGGRPNPRAVRPPRPAVRTGAGRTAAGGGAARALLMEGSG